MPPLTLICAATKWEALPLARALGLMEAAPDVFERPDGRVVLLKTGMGPKNATETLRRWSLLGRPTPSACISAGFAGGLQTGMLTGDIVCDLRGCDLDFLDKARQTARSLDLRIHFGKMLHSDKVLSSAREKTDLGQKERGSAVDMETASLRDFASRSGIACLCVRAVLDAVDESLPGALPAGEDLPSLARYAARNIRELPLLAAIGLKQRRAASALSRFLPSYLEALWES